MKKEAITNKHFQEKNDINSTNLDITSGIVGVKHGHKTCWEQVMCPFLWEIKWSLITGCSVVRLPHF